MATEMTNMASGGLKEDFAALLEESFGDGNLT